jgi:histidine triad (HIT) family protein
MNDCTFCKIVIGELPSTKEYEDENVLVFKNIYPIAQTHLLIIPKKHVATFMDLKGGMDSLVKAAQKVIKDKNLGSGYKLAINGGKYQQVPHFHLHLLAGKLEDNI